MSDKKPIKQLTETPFETIKHIDESGEYWLARELMPLLDYDKWQNFTKIVNKANLLTSVKWSE